MKITIFGLAGTGKSTAGKMVALKLDYDYMSTGNIFRDMARDHNMTLNEFEEFTKTDEKYDRNLDEITVTNYGKENDNFVFESRLAWHFIPDSIKIRLFCDDDTRMQRIANRENKNFEQVVGETKEREKIIYEKYKKLYGLENINNPDNFDLNIDTTTNDANKVVEMILEFVK